MSVRRKIVLAIAPVAPVTVAILFATGSISGAHTAGASPSCIPSQVGRSALLAGTAVTVSPAPYSDSASPATQISFLGTAVTNISNVAVEGARTGYHYGRLSAYFQGDGASFVLEKPFAPGELVHVRASIAGGARPTAVSYSFRVARPYPMQGVHTFPNTPAQQSDVQSFQSAPALHPPVLSVTTPDRDTKAGDVLMTDGPGPGQYGPLVYRSDGQLVWYDPLEPGLAAEDLRVQRYEGGTALTWWQGKVLVLGFGEGEDVVVDPNYQTVARVRAGNGYDADLHDFQIVSNNIAYVTVYDLIRCDLSPVGGARNGVLVDTAMQAIDMRTGLVRWEWHSVDNIDVRESHVPVPKEAIPWDWFHLNSIDPQGNGRVLVSARSTWAAYELDGHSGAVLWRLGGVHPSFGMGAGTETAWQHDARMLPDGTVTMFDNGSNPRVHDQSRGLRLAIDARHRTVKLLRAYPHPHAPLLADSQGNMQTLANGDEVVGWGSNPAVSEFAPDGALLFDAHLPPGTSSYRAFRFDWSGHPLSQPAVSARVLATEDQTAVFASWNGATDVAYWRVLAGQDPGSLRGESTVHTGGFETSITYPESYSEHHAEYVEVQALDAHGALLGTSSTVAAAPPPPAPKP